MKRVVEIRRRFHYLSRRIFVEICDDDFIVHFAKVRHLGFAHLTHVCKQQKK
jgi:hypothetical protein